MNCPCDGSLLENNPRRSGTNLWHCNQCRRMWEGSYERGLNRFWLKEKPNNLAEGLTDDQLERLADKIVRKIGDRLGS